MKQQISEGRKVAYYLGMLLIVLGCLLFGSTFVTAALHFGDFSNFTGQVQSSAVRAISGMALMIAGSVLRAVGARGLAGSGVVLDTRRARQDLEPYSRMAGGMVKDALDEAGVQPGAGSQTGSAQKVVMLKCRTCGKLNEEDSKFCQECGQTM
jgi:hypothetical protein